jgi:hypothetical protein
MGTSMGLGSLSAQSSVLQSSEDRLIQGASLPKGPTDAAKIDKGSREFEAVLVGSWLQQAEQSFASVPGTDDDQDQDVGRGSMMSLGVQTLATGNRSRSTASAAAGQNRRRKSACAADINSTVHCTRVRN